MTRTQTLSASRLEAPIREEVVPGHGNDMTPARLEYQLTMNYRLATSKVLYR